MYEEREELMEKRKTVCLKVTAILFFLFLLYLAIFVVFPKVLPSLYHEISTTFEVPLTNIEATKEEAETAIEEIKDNVE